MKNILLIISLLITSSTWATNSSQMSKILGPWKAEYPGYTAHLLIQKQSEESIKIYEYSVFPDGRTSNSTLRIARYSQVLDGFFVPNVSATLLMNGICSYVYQVSIQTPNQLVRLYNPFGDRKENCSVTGLAEEFTSEAR